MLDFATGPDLLRLLVLPFFGYLAWRDIKTRRIPHRTWYPLVALAVILLVWETYVMVTGDAGSFDRRLFFIRVAISVFLLIPLSYGFWLLGGFGAADAKAFMVIALLLPTYPGYDFGVFGIEGTFATLPLVETNVGVFSMTVLTNTVLVGALYPVALAGKNLVTGYVSPGMIVATPIASTDATEKYGTLLEFADGRFRDVRSLSGLRAYFSWRSLDLDALRMYLEWRGLTLEELRGEPSRYRDPSSIPAEPNEPGDGSIPTTDLSPAETAVSESKPDGSDDPVDGDATDQPEDGPDEGDADAQSEDGPDEEDPWGAEAFLDDIDHSAYGTTPRVLREGLDRLAEDDVVWISPGIPFIVPMFFGLGLSFVHGDVLFWLLGLLGFA